MMLSNEMAGGVEDIRVRKHVRIDRREIVRPSELSVQSAELFWIAKNGIQMTGMPAFGPTTRRGDLESGRLRTVAAEGERGGVRQDGAPLSGSGGLAATVGLASSSSQLS